MSVTCIPAEISRPALEMCPCSGLPIRSFLSQQPGLLGSTGVDESLCLGFREP